MKYGKRLASLLLTAALALGLTACGGEKAASSAPAETASNAAETTPEAPKDTPTTQPEDSAASQQESAAEPEVQRPVVSYPLFDDVTTFTLWTSNSPDLSEIISDLNEYLVFSQLEKETNVRWDATLVQSHLQRYRHLHVRNRLQICGGRPVSGPVRQLCTAAQGYGH